MAAQQCDRAASPRAVCSQWSERKASRDVCFTMIFVKNNVHYREEAGVAVGLAEEGGSPTGPPLQSSVMPGSPWGRGTGPRLA